MKRSIWRNKWKPKAGEHPAAGIVYCENKRLHSAGVEAFLRLRFKRSVITAQDNHLKKNLRTFTNEIKINKRIHVILRLL